MCIRTYVCDIIDAYVHTYVFLTSIHVLYRVGTYVRTYDGICTYVCTLVSMVTSCVCSSLC